MEAVKRLIVIVMLGVIAVLAIADSASQRRTASIERQLRERADSLLASAEAREAEYARDTVVLWRTKVRVDTMTQTVTSWMHDTTKVIEYVYLADSTIRACTSALRTCEEQKRELRSAADAMREAAAAHARTHPSRLESLAWDAAKVLAGFGLGKLVP